MKEKQTHCCLALHTRLLTKSSGRKKMPTALTSRPVAYQLAYLSIQIPRRLNSRKKNNLDISSPPPSAFVHLVTHKPPLLFPILIGPNASHYYQTYTGLITKENTSMGNMHRVKVHTKKIKSWYLQSFSIMKCKSYIITSDL